MAGAVKRSSSPSNAARVPAVFCEQLENRMLLSGSGQDSDSSARLLATSSVFTRAKLPGDAAGKNAKTARNMGRLGRRKTVRDFVGRRDTRDVYKFRTYAGQTIDLRLSGKSSTVSLELFFDADANGKVLASESVQLAGPDGTLSRRITEPDSQAGTYYVVVSQPKGSNNYALTFHGVDDDRLADAQAVGDISTNPSFTGTVGGGDPEDFYRFTLTTRTEVSVALSGLTADVDLQIVRDIDRDGRIEEDLGEVLGESTLEGTTGELVTLRLDAGTYFARVIPVRNVPADYTITFSVGAAGVVNQIDWGQIMVDPDEIEFEDVLGNVVDFESDVYRFELTADATVTINLTDLTDEADLRLYEDPAFDLASLLAESTNFGLADEFITMDLEAGVYFIVVDGLVTAPGSDYSLTVDFT